MKTNSKYIVSISLALGLIASVCSAQIPKEKKPEPEKKITICHLSDDNTTHTLSISFSALNSHLAHGDNIGECLPENSKIILTLHKTDVKCHGGNDGSVSLEIKLSNSINNNPFQKIPSRFNILWSNGATTQNITGLSAGTYSVTVSDSKKTDADENSGLIEHIIGDKKDKFSAIASVEIKEPFPLLADWETKNISCTGENDGSLTVFPQGGTSPYSIVWAGNPGIVSGFSAGNLSPGFYQATITDLNNCTLIAYFPVEEPSPLGSVFEAENVHCSGGNDGSVIVTPEGGIPPYSFEWSPNAGTQYGAKAIQLSQGIFQYTITDANGCIDISPVNIGEPPPVELEFSVKNETCFPGNDGSAAILATGGISPYKYQWDINANSQTGTTATGLSSGTYSVKVFDLNGCVASKSTVISKEKCESRLRDADCGAIMTSLSQVIFCNPIPGATNYQWEFSVPQSGFSLTIQRGFALNNFYLSWVTGIQYGKTYEVRIKPFVNGEWMEYGPVCEITTPGSIPYTKLRVADCGLTTNTLGQVIFCEMVAGALNYQWEFSNDEMGFHELVYRGSNALTFTIGWVPGILYGKTYNVRVRANVGGDWGKFGEVCQVSVVYPIPLTKVRYYDCGKTLTSMSQFIYCDPVAGATDYQWEISNSDINFLEVYQRNAPSTNFQFAWVAGIAYATTYNIRVRVQVAGEWSSFGSICQVTSPNAPISPRMGHPPNEEPVEEMARDEIKLSVFPNPSKGETVKISLSGSENKDEVISLEVYDILGNKVYGKHSVNKVENHLIAEINSNNELPSGLYILNVTAGNRNFFDRIIIK